MKFEWDAEKATANIKKHGLSFDDAIRIFVDKARIIAVDDRLDYGENRWITVGSIHNRLCVVVYTEKKERIRLISARKANKREQKHYEDHKKNN